MLPVTDANAAILSVLVALVERAPMCSVFSLCEFLHPNGYEACELWRYLRHLETSGTFASMDGDLNVAILNALAGRHAVFQFYELPALVQLRLRELGIPSDCPTPLRDLCWFRPLDAGSWLT